MSDLEMRMSELERRFENVIRHGTITEADYEAAKVKVSFGEELTSGWLNWFTARAAGAEVTWSAPEVGERVTVFSPNGDIHQGRVMPAVYSDKSQAPAIDPDVSTTAHNDGGHFTYDRKKHTYVLQPHTDGSVRLLVGKTEIILDKEDINLIADASVSVAAPEVTVTAKTVNVSADTVTVDAPAINLGGAGGEKVARVGDAVNPKTMKIIEGSNVTKSK